MEKSDERMGALYRNVENIDELVSNDVVERLIKGARIDECLGGGDGIQILPEQFPIGMLTLPVGGFLVLGCLIALMQWALSRPKKNKEESK